ncbi:MAG TPA: EamA-like transporter family protein [Desulfobacteraceae bacterium]|nr:EamA-like transporter family protein [Desulfobacteraceae bacterium]|tara:strand:- start:607 stop:1050 length:444 start_codon:yes stop_codon:yes gene_type:complete
MKFFLILLAIVSGAALPIQAALNAKMGKVIEDPVYAALISFVVGSLGLMAYVIAVKTDLTAISRTLDAHWSVWTAGILGAFYVTCVIILAPKLGVALTFGLVVTGQLGISLIIDHYGFLGIPAHAINWPRIAGISLIIAGVTLIRKF